MSSELEDVKREVAAANRVLANLGLATGLTAALGHASMRVPSKPDHFFVKGREYEFDALAVMEPDDMVMCDTEGFLIGGRAGLTQCSEVKIHACIYKTHPKVRAIVHVHPRYTILMSVLTGSIKPMRQEGAQMLRRPLPIYPHVKTIQSDAEGMEVANLLGDSGAILLRGHGAVTTGAKISEAVMGMAHLEEQAQMNYLAYCAQGKDYTFLQDDVLDEMLNRAPLSAHPHFKEVLKGREPQRDGTWNYQKKAATPRQLVEGQVACIDTRSLSRLHSLAGWFGDRRRYIKTSAHFLDRLSARFASKNHAHSSNRRLGEYHMRRP